MECGESGPDGTQAFPMTCFNGAALVGVRRERWRGRGAWGQTGRLQRSRTERFFIAMIRKTEALVLQRSRTRWSAESETDDTAKRVTVKLQRSRTRWSAERAPVEGLLAAASELQRSRTRWSAESQLL